MEMEKGQKVKTIRGGRMLSSCHHSKTFKLHAGIYLQANCHLIAGIIGLLNWMRQTLSLMRNAHTFVQYKESGHDGRLR